MSKSAINPNRKISGLSELADLMNELESRLNAHTEEATNALYSQMDGIEVYEPTEQEIEEMYSARDLEDVASGYCQALNDSF